jgi:hypothetical protein
LSLYFIKEKAIKVYGSVEADIQFKLKSFFQEIINTILPAKTTTLNTYRFVQYKLDKINEVKWKLPMKHFIKFMALF